MTRRAYWWPHGIGSPEWAAYQAELDELVAVRCLAEHGEHVCSNAITHRGAHACRCGHSWFPLP